MEEKNNLSRDTQSKKQRRKMYAAVANQVIQNEINRGLESLHEAEQNLFFAAVLNGEVLNGGITQYFTNSSGKDYKQALAALRAIGAQVQERIIVSWLEDLPPHIRADNRNEVGSHVFADPKLVSKLQYYDEQYFASVDTFYEAVLNYVNNNSDSFKIETKQT